MIIINMLNINLVQQQKIHHLFVIFNHDMKQKCQVSSVLAIAVCLMFKQKMHDSVVVLLHYRVKRTWSKAIFVIALRSVSCSFIFVEILSKNIKFVAREMLKRFLILFRLRWFKLQDVRRRIKVWVYHSKCINVIEFYIIWDCISIDFRSNWIMQTCQRSFIIQIKCILSFRQNDIFQALSIKIQTASALILIYELSFSMFL